MGGNQFGASLMDNKFISFIFGILSNKLSYIWKILQVYIGIWYMVNVSTCFDNLEMKAAFICQS